MATKQILEGARSFKNDMHPELAGAYARGHRWRWPAWPARLSLLARDKYLIRIKPRRSPQT